MPPALVALHNTTARRGRARRLIAAALLAPAILLLLGAATALGAPGTLRLLETSPSLGHSVTITVPSGETFRDEPGRALVRVTPSGGAALQTSAWCVDALRAIDEGVDYPVDLQTPADTPALGDPAAGEAAWLIGRADGLIATAASPGFEAAAIQLAVWQLTGQAADIVAVTDDATLNARVGELRALADGRAPAGSLALSGPGGTVVAGSAATVTVTGTPGTEATVEVSAGAAGLSATRVTLGSDGTAQIVVTPSAAGEVVLTARAEGGVLWRAAHRSGRSAPQDMAYVTPFPLSATTALSVAAAAGPVPGVLGAPPVRTPPVVRPAALRLVKSAPVSALRGRSIPYTLTVTNVSVRTARNVVLRDPLPAGTFLAKAPARARLSGGAVVWRLGNLAPRARVTVHVRLRTAPDASRMIQNVARASAANAATVRARAVTRLRPLPRKVVAPAVVAPAVTG